MRRLRIFLGILTLLTACAGQAGASSLQVAPVRLNIPPQAAASKISLSNLGDEAIQAQVRVFRWVQADGVEKLVETKDVVASPPMIRMAPGKPM